jgi:hypothetical protein
MSDDDSAKPESFSDYGYTAFEKWDYQPFVYVREEKKIWVTYSESFYRASEIIIGNLAAGHGFPDIEGIAAVFLFRHYLELALKRIIVRGRCLIRPDANAAWEDVKEVANVHSLAALWKLVLTDAKPKIDPAAWESYDIPFVENCIAEFDNRDEKGFAFRYPRQGGERYEYDFGYFREAMEHVYQVLENMTTYLIESHAENSEWQTILREEAGF